ncbi:hypothetical protein O181_042348 [Austropuccinia psidii MF-1]|uniref:CCHC-type domain-containing protein n=1 Tax=Austropuccinia psidii MF-1 TaxID=1389203 RepID=A0A9Q3DL07_9BASI|nr:hypothetical protein [Austropuccinia psidii MF-1]
MDKIVKTLQEGHAQLSKASEETNRRLNLVFEEHQRKRDRDCLDQDINKLLNVYHNMKPQPQGHVMDKPYYQDELKPDGMLKALKHPSEAPSWPKFSGTGEYDHMELIDYIDGLFIDVPSIPDYWITARLNTAIEENASIWYTEMKEIHGRRSGLWWKSQMIQKYSNGIWIWQKTMSFESDKYSVDKDPYQLCLRKSKRLKAIDPKMNNQMNSIANALQKVRKRTNIGKSTPYKSSGFKEKQPFRVELKDKHKERVTEMVKKKNSCHNCGSTDHYANNCPKAKRKIYAVEKVPEEESPTEDSESDSMGDGIREQSDKEQDPSEQFLVEYQEETQLEIQDIQLEEDMPQDTANKNLCIDTQDAHTFLVKPTKGMADIHGTATKMTICIDNAQHPLIIDSGAHCSIVARNYLDNHFPNSEKQLLPTKAKNFKSASGKMTFIVTIMKEIILPHGKGNIRHNTEFLVLDDAHIQGFLLGTDYQRMYGIDIYNSKNRHITIGTNKKKKFSLDIYHVSTHVSLEELLNDFREGQFCITLTSKQKTSLETRKKIEKHINELLDMDVIRKIGNNEIMEITTPVLITWNDCKSRLCGDFRALNNYTKADRYAIPRIPHALEKLAKAKYITKIDCMKGFHQNGVKPNSMKLLRIILHMGIYEYTRMPFCIKNAPAHFQRMMDTIFQEDILEGWMVVYIDDIIIYSETWEDHLQYIDRVLSKCTPINLKISLEKCNFVQQEVLALGHKVSGLSLAIDQNKVAVLLQKPVSRNNKEMESFLGFASYYRNPIKDFAHITSSLYKLCSKDVVFEITKERRDKYEKIKYELTNELVLVLPDFELPFKLYIDTECSQGLGEALHQRKIIDGAPREGVICYISRQLKH